MTLKEEIRADLKEAMRSKDESKRDTLRMIISAIETEEKMKGKEFDDSAVQVILKRELKKREESFTAFSEAGQKERADLETIEAGYIQAYLPQTLNAAALDLAASVAIRETGASSIKDMGKVMKWLTDSYGVALDGKAASSLVKEKLNARN